MCAWLGMLVVVVWIVNCGGNVGWRGNVGGLDVGGGVGVVSIVAGGIWGVGFGGWGVWSIVVIGVVVVVVCYVVQRFQ